jgi:hypothetical protein
VTSPNCWRRSPTNVSLRQPDRPRISLASCPSGASAARPLLGTLRLGRRALGIELKPDSVALAERRIRNDAPLDHPRHGRLALDALHDCAYSKPVEIEWDAKKAASNLRKHGIDFADAALVLEDDLALTRPDLHSHHEERFVTLGCDPQGRLLVLVYT